MKKQDTGYRMQDTNPGTQSLNPESSILDTVSLERVRWRCRRGLLELDIVLGRFVRQRYQAMNDEQRLVFDELLAMPDTELWDVITGKKEAVYAHQHEVLGWLREA